MLQHRTLERASALSAPPRLWTLEQRLQTFAHGGWPAGACVRPVDLAEAGFYSLRRGDDGVQCAYCGVVVSRWEPGDEPRGEHRRWSPRCPFLGTAVDAVSYDTCGPYETSAPTPTPAPVSLPVQHTVKPQRPSWPNFSRLQARLDSFRNWPPALPVKKEVLSEAGFFYSGKGDRTVCYYCGVGLRDWVPGDDPWVEHELWFPGCAHVELNKGRDFVQRISEEREALIAARSSTSSQSSAPPVITLQEKLKVKGEDEPCNEGNLCKICYEKEMGVVFLPCGHIVACVECALSVQNCPVCRQPFEATAKIYLP